MSPGAPSSTQDESQQLQALRAEVERLQSELDGQRERFDRELMRKAYRIADLEQRIEEIAAQQALNYESSLSWRITKPLRIGKRLARGR
jgi:septal ring factor EnvC (AmiA/AmiB activator)